MFFPGPVAIRFSMILEISIFMLLFFFMVTTVMREVELKVAYNPATANQTKKLEDKALVIYIYI